MRCVVCALAFVSACAPAEAERGERPDASWLGVAPGIPHEGASARFASFDYAHFALDPSALPSSVDWRSVGGESFVTDVRNQGPHGTCVAFSGTAAVESALAVQADVHGLDLAEQWLVTTCGTVDPVAGYYVQLIGQDIVAHGMIDEGQLPYTGEAAGCPGGVAAEAGYAVGTTWMATGTQVKAAVLASPLIVGLDAYDDLFDYDGGVYRVSDTATLVGGHSVLLVGYDDAQQAWIAKNSWGTGWGEDGFFRIAYDDTKAGFGAYGVLLEVAGGDPTRGAQLVTDAGLDLDADGWFAFEDCDDSDAGRHPGVVDGCDGVDQDCDGTVDEDCPPVVDTADTADATDTADPGPALHPHSVDGAVVTPARNCSTGGSPVPGLAVAMLGLLAFRRRAIR